MSKMKRRWVGLNVVLTWHISFSMADTIYVDASATSGQNTGTSWVNAYVSLQSALAAATEGDEIWVADGTYFPSQAYPNSNDPRAATFRIPRAVRVLGGFHGADFSQQPPCCGETAVSERNELANPTILDGNIDVDGDEDSYHVVYIDDADYTTTKLSGFIIRNGRADGDGLDGVGGGLLVTAAFCVEGPALDRLVVRDNYASAGGGGICIDGQPWVHLANVRFESNLAADGPGGGMLVRAAVGCPNTVTLQNCVFFANHSPNGPGGGLAALAPGKLALRVVNGTFVANTAAADAGGAIYSELQGNDSYWQLAVSNSILWGNSPPQVGTRPDGPAAGRGRIEHRKGISAGELP